MSEIYISLPNFYENYLINNVFLKIQKDPKLKVMLKNDKLNFSNNYGAFCNSTWAGYNTFYSGIIKNLDIDVLLNKNRSYITLDCSNIFLEETDIHDRYQNIILEKLENGVNKIEISNLTMMEELHEKYPFFSFVISPEMYFLNMENYTPEVLNAIAENPLVSEIKLAEHVNKDWEFLNKLKNKGKFSIAVNPKCDFACSSYNQCHFNDHLAQLIYSEKCIFETCPNVNKKFGKHIISIEDIEKDYLPKGFNHFYLTQFNMERNRTNPYYNNYFYKLAEYFIKPEYYLDFLELLTQEM